MSSWLTVVLLHAQLVVAFGTLNLAFSSLSIEGEASDTYVKFPRLRLGVENTVNLNIATVGPGIEVAGQEIDATKIKEHFQESFQEYQPGFLVIEAPSEFHVHSISVDPASQCKAIQPMFSIERSGKTVKALPIKGNSTTSCLSFKVSIKVSNADKFIYPKPSRWTAYLVTERAADCVKTPGCDWDSRTNVAARGAVPANIVYPLIQKVNTLHGTWSVTLHGNCTTEHKTFERTVEAALMSVLYGFMPNGTNGFSSAYAQITCTDEFKASLEVDVLPAQEDRSYDLSTRVSKLTGNLTNISIFKDVTPVKPPSVREFVLDTTSKIGNAQVIVLHVLCIYTLLALVCQCGLIGCSLMGTDIYENPCLGIILVLFGFPLMASIPVIIVGFIFAIVLMAIFQSAVLGVRILVIFFPTRFKKAGDLEKVGNKITDVLSMVPKSAVHYFRFIFDFTMMYAAISVMYELFDFDLSIDLQWWKHFSWPAFFIELPDWWQWLFIDFGFGFGLGEILARWTAYFGDFFSRCIAWLSNWVPDILGWFGVGTMGAPCRESMAAVSLFPSSIGIFVLYIFISQDMQARYIPWQILAKQKWWPFSVILPGIIEIVKALDFMAMQQIAVLCAYGAALGNWFRSNEEHQILTFEECAWTEHSFLAIWLHAAIHYTSMSWILLWGVLVWITASGIVWDIIFSKKAPEKVDQEAEVVDGDKAENLVGHGFVDVRKILYEGLGAMAFMFDLDDAIACHQQKIKDVGCCRWLLSLFWSFMQAGFGVWAQQVNEANEEEGEEGEGSLQSLCAEWGESVVTYNVETRTKYAQQLVKERCETEMAENGVDNDADERAYFNDELDAKFDSQADEMVVRATSRQISVIWQVIPFFGIIPAKFIEYSNQIILFDCSGDLAVVEAYLKIGPTPEAEEDEELDEYGHTNSKKKIKDERMSVAYFFLIPLWLAAMFRLSALLLICLAPIFPWVVTKEVAQQLFAFVTVTCIFSGIYETIAGWFKDFDKDSNPQMIDDDDLEGDTLLDNEHTTDQMDDEEDEE